MLGKNCFSYASRLVPHVFKKINCNPGFCFKLEKGVWSKINNNNNNNFFLLKVAMNGCRTKPECRDRSLHSSATVFCKRSENDAKSVIQFFEFAEVSNKSQETFYDMISLYSENFPTRKGVVDFIYAALKHIEEFGAHENLETYKKLIDLMPKGKYVSTNPILASYMYHPKEQECMLWLLTIMEHHGVAPDVEIGTMLENIFGSLGVPVRKFYRMMYWIPKMKKINPFLISKHLPKDSFLLGKLAIERITGVDLQTKISVFQTENVEASIDKTWIVSGQSPTQRRLLEQHDCGSPVIVEGGDYVYLRKERINYFVLKSENIKLEDISFDSKDDVSNLQSRFLNLHYKERVKRSLHEQEDGIIYAVCATGTSSKDSLLSWIRLLQERCNPKLEDLAVLFRFKKVPDQPVLFSESLTGTKNQNMESV